MCWEPQPRPDSPWSLSNWAILRSPLPAFFPSPRLSPPPRLPGTIPPRAAGNPPVCWKASFTGTQQPFQTDMWFGAQNEYNKHLNLSVPAEWLLTGSGEGNTLTGRMFMPWRLKTCKRGLGTIFQGLSSQTEQDHVCLSWQTGHMLSSMFSIQIASEQLYCFRDNEQCTVMLQWSKWYIRQGPITLCKILCQTSGNECFAHFYCIINQLMVLQGTFQIIKTASPWKYTKWCQGI